MAFQITYYADRAMRRRQAASDNIGDAGFARYPAPTGGETAFARHSENPELSVWGYDGDWRCKPPHEAVEADRRDEVARKAAAEAADFAARPHVLGYLAQDPNTLVINVPGRARPEYLRIEDLRAAASQDDPEGRRIYSLLLGEANKFLSR